MVLSITPNYAAALTLLFIVLSARVIGYRKSRRVSLGDGGDPGLLARMRAQGNCAEYAPLGLLLMLIAELQGAPALGLHLAGISLLIGRMAHAAALSGPMNFPMRTAGMALTFVSLGLSAILGLL